MTAAWTTPSDIEARLRRRWDDGSLLRAHAGGAAFEPIEISVRGPRSSEIGDDLVAVRSWIASLDAGRDSDRRYALEWRLVGGRHIGRNELPARAVVSTPEQAWALLGVRTSVRRFDEILALADTVPAVRAWVIAHPHQALALHDDLASLISAYVWLDAHRGSRRYLREISAPGVDTKFAEKHRSVLAAMLGVSSTSAGLKKAKAAPCCRAAKANACAWHAH